MPRWQSDNEYYLNINLNSSKKSLKNVIGGITTVARSSRWDYDKTRDIKLFTDVHKRPLETIFGV